MGYVPYPEQLSDHKKSLYTVHTGVGKDIAVWSAVLPRYVHDGAQASFVKALKKS